jgi:hypothetical protein
MSSDRVVNILRQEATKFCSENGITDAGERLIIEAAFIRGGMIATREVIEDFKRKKVE